MQGQISGKLQDMKKSIMGLSSIDKKAESYVENLLEFRKKHYWEHESETSVKVKEFLTKMKRVQSEHKRSVKKENLKQEVKMQKSIEQEKKKDE